MDAICKHATYMHLLEGLTYKKRFSCMLLTNILAEISISLALESSSLPKRRGRAVAALKHGI